MTEPLEVTHTMTVEPLPEGVDPDKVFDLVLEGALRDFEADARERFEEWNANRLP